MSKSMLDRTDLQLMLVEQIKNLETENLLELLNQLTGSDLRLHSEEEEIVVGSIDIDDPADLKTWLGFLLNVVGEREAQCTVS